MNLILHSQIVACLNQKSCPQGQPF
jgi:hypothetical protein